MREKNSAASLQAIAQRVGVSISTVSKAMNGATDISSKTRSRILAAAGEVGYPVKKASPIARTIGTVGVVCPEIRSAYYANILSVMEKMVNEKGYDMSVVSTNFDPEYERKALKSYIDNNVAGIILITESSHMNGTLLELRDSIAMPLVLIALGINTADYDNLIIDEATGINLAVDHLIELGHTDIGFISDALTVERLNRFRDAMAERHVQVSGGHIFVAGDGKRFEECGYEGAKAILGAKRPPTAIIAGYDDIAIGAMRLIQESGLSVPGDVSIVGIDDIKVSRYLPVSLTTVAYPIDDMSGIATKILLRKMRNPEYRVVQHVTLRPELIVRESTGKPYIENI